MLRSRLNHLLLSALLCLGLVGPALAQPVLTRRVTDLTQTLSGSESLSLETRLNELERSKGSQLAVLIVATTEPETIEEYALHVAEKAKLGRGKTDDGVLLLIAKNDRAMRIEVGYGLEGALNDATAKRIISEIITPHFRQGRFYDGVSAGVDAISKVINGEELPAPVKGWDNGQGTESILILIIVLAIPLAQVFASFFGRLVGGAIVGVAGGFIAAFFVPFLMAMILGFFLFIAAQSSGLGRTFGGNWSSGGRGFGGGGGGFRGGGGRFGGGGASGRW